MNKENKRIKEIEGLRGVSAIIVVLNHFMVGFFPASYWGNKMPSHMRYNIDTHLAQSPLSLFYAGNFAVCMFLIISGFVLTNIFYNYNNEIEKVATKRYLRLFIPIFISTIISFFFMKFGLFFGQEAASITGSKWLNGLYNFNPDFKDMLSVTIFDVFFVGNSKYNTVFWMISFLFYGSFLTFLLLKIWGNNKKRIIIYSIIILVLCKYNNAYYVAFIFGIICADLYINNKNLLNKLNYKIINFIMLFLGVYLAGYPKGITPTNIFYSWLKILHGSAEMYHTIAAFILFLVIISNELIKKILKKSIIQYLGKISFSIYLIHIIVLCSFSSKLFIFIWNITNKYQLSFIIMFIPSMLIIIIVSHFFYNIVEKNSNILIEKLYKKFNE